MSEADIWRLVRLAGVRDGRVIPETPVEVAEAERHVDEAAVELPAALSVANIMRAADGLDNHPAE